MHLAFQPARSRNHALDAYAAFDPLAAAADLAASLAAPRARHNRTGGHGAREGDWIRASSLLALCVPREHGGGGASWQTVLETVRIVARANRALARLLGLHHLQIATIQLYASPHRRHRLLAASVAEDLIWADAVQPLDRDLVATPVAGGYLLNGTKHVACGAEDADWLTVSAWDPLARASLVAVLPTGQPGVAVRSGSGIAHVDGVLLPEENVLQSAAQRAAPQTALRAQIAELVMANIDLGAGAADAAAANALADAAARLDFAFACDANLDAAERDALAAAVGRAQALARVPARADTTARPLPVNAAHP